MSVEDFRELIDKYINFHNKIKKYYDVGMYFYETEDDLNFVNDFEKIFEYILLSNFGKLGTSVIFEYLYDNKYNRSEPMSFLSLAEFEYPRMIIDNSDTLFVFLNYVLPNLSNYVLPNLSNK